MKIQNPHTAGGTRSIKKQPRSFWKTFGRFFTAEFASLSILEILVISAIVGGGIYYVRGVVQKAYEQRLTEKIVGLEKCQSDSQKAAEQNAFDQVRISDTTNILLALQDYNFSKSDLPAGLAELKSDGYLDGNINDPEAGKPYYYAKLSPTDYVLCVYLTIGVWGTNTGRCPSKVDFFNSSNPPAIIATTTTVAATSTSSIKKIIISSTPTGTLNIRASSSLSAIVLTKAAPGEEFEVVSEQDSWVEIKLNKAVELDGVSYSSGWVSKEYTLSE